MEFPKLFVALLKFEVRKVTQALLSLCFIQ